MGYFYRNNIEIKNISYHYYDKYNTYRHSDVFKKYQEKNYPGKIYLLGTGPMSSYFLKDLKDVKDLKDFKEFELQ